MIVSFLLIIQSALVFPMASAQITDRPMIEDDRENATAFARQWAEDYLNYLAIAEVSPIDSVYQGDEKTIRNIECRKDCAHVYFLEESNLPEKLDSCAILISHSDWEHWLDVINDSAMKKAHNHQSEGKMERAMKFLGKISDWKKWGMVQDTKLHRNLTFEKAMGRDCER